MGCLGARGVVATHNRAAARSAARGGGIRVSEEDALLCQGVDVRRLHRARFGDVVTLHILPTEVSGQYEDDIGLRGGVAADCAAQQDSEEGELVFDHSGF